MASTDQKAQEEKQNKRFESDAQKLANQHLADPDHVITDEDFKNIRVGMTPPPDEPTRQAISDANEKVADHKADNADDTISGSQKATPWDVLK